MPKLKRTRLFPIFVIIGASLVGGIFGPYILASAKNVYQKAELIFNIMELIENNYVEKVDQEQLFQSAIDGMLKSLDPHSYYVNAEDYRLMQERYRGDYQGIGITFDVIEGVLTVISTFEGGPSHKLGIRAGDQIVEVNGQSIIGITNEKVFALLRGEKGSSVEITVRRLGQEELLHFTIVRDKIPINSISYKFMITPEIGYINMARFSQTTSSELDEALKKLKAEGMQKLLFDLRNNHGGYLLQAVAVSDRFLPGGDKIVYTKGRIANSDEIYISTKKESFVDIPMIILINKGSASASEIVAGAMQDLDRALIVGERSFGKGLVQNQYRFSDGSALFLTTAKYYTPSGRLIQRNYKGNTHYFEEIFDDKWQPKKEGDVFTTAHGRKVYGGGGINPDVEVPSDYYGKAISNLLQKNMFFAFSNEFVAENAQLAQDFNSFLRDFKVDQEIMAEFYDFLKKNKVEFDRESLEKELNYVKILIKAEIASKIWGRDERFRVILNNDNQVNSALGLFQQAEELISWMVSRKAA
jgi:carboxyl-terminal processing protease